MDVAGANAANGTPVQLYDCNGTTAQQWTVSPTAPYARWASAWMSPATARRTARPYSCGTAQGRPNQKWAVSAAHDIVNPQANKCLDATGNSSANGTRLQIWSCSGGAPTRKWTVN